MDKVDNINGFPLFMVCVPACVSTHISLSVCVALTKRNVRGGMGRRWMSISFQVLLALSRMHNRSLLVKKN